MKEKIITNNGGERMIVRWDGERFALISFRKAEGSPITNVILLNPKEMISLISFAGTLGEGK